MSTLPLEFVQTRHGPRVTPEGRSAMLGSAAASVHDRWLALALSALLFAAFIITAPFATMPLRPLPAFVPSYNAAVMILDLITAVLLYAQYREIKRHSLLALACAYAFTPPLIAAHALSFPDSFQPGYLLGADQTTPWLWMGWHSIFPVLVGVYAVLAWSEREAGRQAFIPHRYFQPPAMLAATLLLSLLLVVLAVAGEELLPELMLGNSYRSMTTKWILAAGWTANVVALFLVVQLTRMQRLIDLWVAVMLLASLIDLALSAILIDARYQLGFYAGRVYGLLAASFILVLLLRETFRLQADVAHAWDALQASEEQFRRAIEEAPVPVLILAEDEQVFQLSKAWTDATGYAQEDMPTLTAWLSRSRVRGAGEIKVQLRRLLDGGMADLELELELSTRSGEPRRWIFSAAAPGILRDGRRFLVGMALDITERKNMEAALRDSEARFRALAEASPVLVWQVDAQGKGVYINQRCVDLTGLSHEQLAESGWHAIVHPDDLPAFAALLSRSVRQRSAMQGRIRARISNGQWHWFDCCAAPWCVAGGEYRGHVGVAIDVTEGVQAENALKEGNQRKDEFLATLAHELRNPLAPISNALHLLTHAGCTGPAAERLVAMMDRQVRHMVRMVDDLLEISRITSGKIKLVQDRVDLVGIVRGAVETSMPLIQKSGHMLVLDLPERPLWIRADAMRMNQVVSNLLNNAAKYTEDGGHIRVCASGQGRQAVVSVSDDGLGMPPEMLNDVFELFRQIPGAAHKGQGGLGIGLSMVQRLAQMHDGTVEAHSDGVGKGSEFILRLPLLEDVGPVAGLGAEPCPRQGMAQLAGRQVLVVDDNFDAADTLAALLRAEGAEVRVAHDGRMALAELEHYRPHAIVLDIGLPDISGYEVARRIRKRVEMNAVRLIALSGWGQENDRAKSRECGIDAHLTKPVDLGRLQVLLVS